MLVDLQSHPGHVAWAARQSAMWHSMATQAESKFTTLLRNDPPPEVAKVLQPNIISWLYIVPMLSVSQPLPLLPVTMPGCWQLVQ
jgi:hypothetical protein